MVGACGRNRSSQMAAEVADHLPVVVVMATEEYRAVPLHRKEESFPAMGMVQVNQKEAERMES